MNYEIMYMWISFSKHVLSNAYPFRPIHVQILLHFTLRKCIFLYQLRTQSGRITDNYFILPLRIDMFETPGVALLLMLNEMIEMMFNRTIHRCPTELSMLVINSGNNELYGGGTSYLTSYTTFGYIHVPYLIIAYLNLLSFPSNYAWSG